MSSRRTPLLLRIWGGFTLLQVVALASLALAVDAGLHRMALGETQRRLAPYARSAAAEIAQDELPLVAGALDGFCRRHARISGARVSVVLPDGRFVGDSHFSVSELGNIPDRPEIMAALAHGHGVHEREGTQGSGNTLYLAESASRGHGTLAVVRLAESLSYLDQPLDDLRRRGFMVLALAGLGLAGLGWLLALRMTRPLSELGRAAGDYARGDLSRRLEDGVTKEFHEISRGLSGMKAQLEGQLGTIQIQNEELESVLSSMREGLVALDTDLRVLRVNPAAATMMHSPADVIGKSFTEVCRDAGLLGFAIRSLGSTEGVEDDIVILSGGEERTWQVRGNPLRDMGGKQVGTLLVLQDVTRLRRLETVRRDFASNVSHELRTPVTAIKGFAETLLEGEVSTAESRKFIEVIARQSARLQRIIEDLLALSRLEKDEQGGDLEEVEAARIVEGSLSNARQAADRKGISLSTQIGPGLRIRVNPALMEQALGNLLDNAITYSPEKSSVRVEVQSQEGSVEFRVIDRGPGISQEHLPRLFERFYRVDKARSRQSGGTGLGLSIVKHIAKVHGGDVGVESRVGEGSQFWIRLPCHA